MLDKFVEGLQLIKDNFLKDSDHNHDIYDEHDCITVWTVDWNKVTFEDVRKLKKFGFDPGCSDDEFVDINAFLKDEGVMSEGEYFDWEKITEEQWEVLKNYVEDCFSYYC